MLKTSTHNTIQTVDIEIIAFIVKKINYAYLVTIYLRHCAFCLWYFAIARSTAQTSARNACSFFLYPFQRLRKRKLNGMVLWYFAVAHTNAKNSAQALCRFINKNRHFCVAKSAFVYKKCECILHSHSFLVGVTGLEPMAS